jgi:mxaK protein
MRFAAGVAAVSGARLVVKRASIHVVFAAVALCCAGVAAYDWSRLQRAQHINQEVADTGKAAKAGTTATTGAQRNERNDDVPREVRLARAIALSKAGTFETAGPLFEDLIRDQRLDEVGRAALFDLGNMYLREGMGDSTSGTVQSVAMVEEAKTRYRTLLRSMPDDWDARYNLERALWLVPEARSGSETAEMKNQHNVTLSDPQDKDLP